MEGPVAGGNTISTIRKVYVQKRIFLLEALKEENFQIIENL